MSSGLDFTSFNTTFQDFPLLEIFLNTVFSYMFHVVFPET